MKIKGIADERFGDYKKPAMFIAFPYCSFKCEKECGRTICQNSSLAQEKNLNISPMDITWRYIRNPISKAIVFGGLEPFDSWEEMINLILHFRVLTKDDIVIYTGYTEEELKDKLPILKEYRNIIVKFGRFVPDQVSHYDEVLGTNLASPNQYAKRIS